MAEITLLPSATGSTHAYINGAGTPPTNVQTNDGDISYRRTQDGDNTIDLFAMDDLPSAAANINTVTHGVYSDGSATITYRIRHYYNGTGANSGDVTSGNGSYVLRTWAPTTDPEGNSWSVPVVNGMEVGYRRVTPPAANHKVTQVYSTVEYTSGGGGMITAFLQWLPPLFAVASHGLLKCEVTQILSKLNPRPSNDEEVRKILEAFRVRPCYNF